MTGQEFVQYRKRLKKTQKQLAALLGISIKAVHSYEQGWRSIPAHAQRQMLYLVSRLTVDANRRMCWEVMECPHERRRLCPAWELRSGELCWFINGAWCQGRVHRNWSDKMEICRSCRVFQTSLQPTAE